MRCRIWAPLALGLAALFPLGAVSQAQERSPDATIGEPPADASAAAPADEEGAIEELTRGPVHEAFAEQVSINPVESIVVPEAPPEAVNEIPPEAKPADAKAVWIDGYWAWDDVDKRYIWISGVWRVAPKGYRWTPGYWTEADGGWRWIGGFWTGADRTEVAYQPEPPASLEEGPTSEAPSENHIWVPGCWYYRYTQRGYVLCGGYYDVPLVTRGSLFAPIFFHRPIYSTPNWYYTPRVAISIGALNFHMFVRPNYCHYYFGDYYGSRYSGLGWYPWHTFHRHRGFYDPLFAFNVWRYQRRGIDFFDRYDRWHRYYDRHEDFRPRHTWKEQRDWIARNRDGNRDGWQQSNIAERFEDRVRENRDRFVSLDRSDRERYQEIRDRTRSFRRERAQQEAVADAREGREGREGGEGRGGRDRGSLRLPDAIGGGDVSRGDREGRGDRGGREGRDGRGDGQRNVLRPDLDRDTRGGDTRTAPAVDTSPDGAATPDARGDRGNREGRGGRDFGRGDRGGDTTVPSVTPDTPAATPGDSQRGDAARDRIDGDRRGGRLDRGTDGRDLPALPRVDSRGGRSGDLTPPRRDVAPRGGGDGSSEIDRRESGSILAPRTDPRPQGDNTRSDVRGGSGLTPRGGSSDIDRRGTGSILTPRTDPRPQGDNTRSDVRGGIDRGSSRSLDRPSITPNRPSITPNRPSVTPNAPTITPRAPSIQPRGDSGASRQITPRTQANRPSFDSGSRSISPRSGASRSFGGAGSSFAPRSGGQRSSTPSFTPRSSGGGGSAIRGGGGGRSSGPSFRSGGGGGGSRAIGGAGGGGRGFGGGGGRGGRN